MRRKIIKQAGQAYTITLPVDWVRKNKLEKRGEVDVVESGKSIVISSDNPTEGGEIKIEIKDEIGKRNLYLHLNALYAKGIDKIELVYGRDVSAEIMRALGGLLGYALVSKQGNTYTIKDIGGGRYDSVDEIFKRVFQIILLFYEEASEDVLGKQKESDEALRERDIEVNKFCLLLQRAINKMSYPNPIDGRTLFTYSYALEEIGDEIYRFWKCCLDNKIKIDGGLADLIKLCKNILGETFDFYYQFNSQRIDRLYSLREEMRKKAEKLKKFDFGKARLIGHLNNIADEAVGLSHLSLMMALGRS